MYMNLDGSQRKVCKTTALVDGVEKEFDAQSPNKNAYIDFPHYEFIGYGINYKINDQIVKPVPAYFWKIRR